MSAGHRQLLAGADFPKAQHVAGADEPVRVAVVLHVVGVEPHVGKLQLDITRQLEDVARHVFLDVGDSILHAGNILFLRVSDDRGDKDAGGQG